MNTSTMANEKCSESIWYKYNSIDIVFIVIVHSCILLVHSRHGPIQRIVGLERLIHPIPIPALKLEADPVSRKFSRGKNVINRVQSRIGRAENHLAHVVEAVVDVVPRMGSRLWRLRPLACSFGPVHDRAPNPIKTVQCVKHGDRVRPWARVRV